MTRGRPPRLAAPLYVGLQRYSFTICCHDRKPHLESPATRKLIVGHLLRTSTQHDVEVIAYCMMPDHLHIIGEGKTDAADGLEFVRSFKQTSSYEWKKQNGGRLWQTSFYNRVLRDDESTQDAVRYVLENPVRKKLVRSPEEYEHSGSLVHDRYALIEWAFGWRSK